MTNDTDPWVTEDEDMIVEDRTPASGNTAVAARITARLAELEQAERSTEINLVAIRTAIAELRAVLVGG